MPEISVIVPVHNVEKYLPACVDSILAQSFTNFELLLIDDGSTDASGKICDAYAQKDARVQVTHKANSGPSDARNLGLDQAAGRYIAFVDSDDFVASTYLRVLYDGMVQNDVGISQCEFIATEEDGTVIDAFQPTAAGLINSHDAMHILADGRHLPQGNTMGCPCTKLYRSALFKGIRFPAGRFFEDYAIMPQLIDAAELIFMNNQPLYFYRQRKGSILHTLSHRHVFDKIEADKARLAFFQNHCYDELLVYAVRAYWSNFYTNPTLFFEQSGETKALADAERRQLGQYRRLISHHGQYGMLERVRLFLYVYCPTLMRLYYKITKR